MADTQEMSGDTTSDEAGDRPARVEPSSGVGVAASELAASLRDARISWSEMGGADKGTLWAAILLMLTTFAPFVGVPGDPWRPGIMAGGWGLWVFALGALRLTSQRAQLLGIMEAGNGDLADHEGRELRRISLMHLVVGALCTLYAVYLVVLYWKFSEVRTVTGERMVPILRPALFVAVFFSTGLAYAGLARFRADAARRRSG